MRKIGINTIAVRGSSMGMDDYLRTVKSLGFETTFTGICPELSEQEKLAELISKHGLEYEFTHSDFAGINNMWLEGEDGDAMLATLKRNVDFTAAVGVDKTVVHLSSGNTPPSISDVGRARYVELVEYAASKGVAIEFENLRKLANVAWAMETFEDYDNVGFCWDCGHENCYTKEIEFMPLFGKRLVCTHIHDNRGIKDGDDHMLPFDGSLDFDRFARRMKESGYKGSIMLEVFKSDAFYKDITCEEYLLRAAAAAKRLRDMVDGE